MVIVINSVIGGFSWVDLVDLVWSPNLMLIVYTPGPGRDVMKFNS